MGKPTAINQLPGCSNDLSMALLPLWKFFDPSFLGTSGKHTLAKLRLRYPSQWPHLFSETTSFFTA